MVSIFVNPIQFDRRDDYEAYAIDLAKDVEFCAALGVDLVFAPSAQEMYPAAAQHVRRSGRRLRASLRQVPSRTFSRRGHRGCEALQHCRARIVRTSAKRTRSSWPSSERMVADLNIPVEIVPVPTVRETGWPGLELQEPATDRGPERRVAPALYQALQIGAELHPQRLDVGRAGSQRSAIAQLQEQPEFRVEYLEVVDASSMTPVETISGPVRIATAAWLGSVRLIDNVMVDNIKT